MRVFTSPPGREPKVKEISALRLHVFQCSTAVLHCNILTACAAVLPKSAPPEKGFSYSI